MSLQIFGVIKRPPYAFFAATTFLIFTILFLYFDEFVFFSPFFVVYFPPSRFSFLLLDILVAVLSGVVLALSVFQTRSTKLRIRTEPTGKVGLAGIIVAVISGACPCYYLVPLLTFVGGAGGVLAMLGIFLNAYELPIKGLSLILLAAVVFNLERSLRATCRIQ